jgi:hypothetical protein
MTRSVSLGVMVKQLSGLLDTNDLNEWEQTFVGDIAHRTREGEDTTRLTERQVGVIERIWSKHFA